jgi:hypothetical protein
MFSRENNYSIRNFVELYASRRLRQDYTFTHNWLYIYCALTWQEWFCIFKLEMRFLFSVLTMRSQGHTQTHSEPACCWCKNYGERKIREQGTLYILHNADMAFFSLPLNTTRFLYNLRLFEVRCSNVLAFYRFHVFSSLTFYLLRALITCTGGQLFHSVLICECNIILGWGDAQEVGYVGINVAKDTAA